jgi:hypothetical protein
MRQFAFCLSLGFADCAVVSEDAVCLAALIKLKINLIPTEIFLKIAAMVSWTPPGIIN